MVVKLEQYINTVFSSSNQLLFFYQSKNILQDKPVCCSCTFNTKQNDVTYKVITTITSSRATVCELG